MPKLMRNCLLLAKPETVYGTDAGPTAAANAILCRAATPQPLVGEFVDRSLMRPYFGNAGKINVANHSEIEFEVELAGSGTAGTAPKWGVLMRGCAFSETIAAATSVTYAPITSAQESLTLWYYLDGLLHKLAGARGSVALGLSAKGIPVLKFKFVGKYSNPTDTPVATGADYTGFKVPLAINKTNVPVCTLHGIAANMQSLDLDVANQVVFRALTADESVYITDRDPTGSISFEMTSLATKNWFQSCIAADALPIQMTIGTVAGNIVDINGPKAQLSNPQYQDSDSIVMMQASLDLLPNVGNDELTITVK